MAPRIVNAILPGEILTEFNHAADYEYLDHDVDAGIEDGDRNAGAVEIVRQSKQTLPLANLLRSRCRCDVARRANRYVERNISDVRIGCDLFNRARYRLNDANVQVRKYSDQNAADCVE